MPSVRAASARLPLSFERRGNPRLDASIDRLLQRALVRAARWCFLVRLQQQAVGSNQVLAREDDGPFDGVSSSRTLPLQECASNACSAAAESSRLRPRSAACWVRKWRASGRISSVRSRSGASNTGITERRKKRIANLVQKKRSSGGALKTPQWRR